MKRRAIKWREIKSALAMEGQRVPAPRSAGAFWEEFRARLPLYPQIEAETQQRRRPLYWALSGASAAMMAVAVMLITWRPAAVSAATDVLSYNITTPHNAVMIWRDQATDATILWVSAEEGAVEE